MMRDLVDHKKRFRIHELQNRTKYNHDQLQSLLDGCIDLGICHNEYGEYKFYCIDTDPLAIFNQLERRKIVLQSKISDIDLSMYTIQDLFPVLIPDARKVRLIVDDPVMPSTSPEKFTKLTWKERLISFFKKGE